MPGLPEVTTVNNKGSFLFCLVVLSVYSVYSMDFYQLFCKVALIREGKSNLVRFRVICCFVRMMISLTCSVEMWKNRVENVSIVIK